MRLKLGLLRDTAAIEKQAAKEAAEAKAKKAKAEFPTVKTEAQTKAEEAAAAKEKSKSGSESKAVTGSKVRIRPLSEAKAIESGANFISEGFLFLVGASVILFESWRSRRKETSRRLDVAEKINELEEREKASRHALVELEKELLRLRALEEKSNPQQIQRILPQEVIALEEQDEREARQDTPQQSPTTTAVKEETRPRAKTSDRESVTTAMPEKKEK